jgi:predicted SnoaL-like aldol condensation-catalyzing enzyme
MRGSGGLAIERTSYINVTCVTLSSDKYNQPRSRVHADFAAKEKNMRRASLWMVALALCLPVMAQTASQQETNKSVARSFFDEVLDQGHLDRYPQSHAPDFVAHAGDYDASLAEDIAAAKEERKALPDMRVKVNQILAERDLVAVYWTASGTNTQEGMGSPQPARKLPSLE